uniref:Uncharacterized protein n=1 Tax=Nelumbo nucifera TaxID=4432 RepID=A0A822YP02_NELNU|nr:TPA_asm: hypothetical protein HUJ06_004922 [Nelumbo nucifera]
MEIFLLGVVEKRVKIALLLSNPNTVFSPINRTNMINMISRPFKGYKSLI